MVGRAHRESRRARAGTARGVGGGRTRRAGADRRRGAAAMKIDAKALIAALGLAALAQIAVAAPDEHSPYVANGCYQCHGYAGQGGAGARIARTAYPFD